jgi:hypothetical protein
MNNSDQILIHDEILTHGGIPTLPSIPGFVYLPTASKLDELKSLTAKLLQAPELNKGALLSFLLAICDDICSRGNILFKHFYDLIITFPIFLSAKPLIDISRQTVINLEYYTEIITRDIVILIFQLVESNTIFIELNGSYLGINDIRVWPIHGGFAVKCMQSDKINMYSICINKEGDVKCTTILLNDNKVDLSLTTTSGEILKIIENWNNNIPVTAIQQLTVQSYKHVKRNADPLLNPISAFAPKTHNSGLLVKSLNDVNISIPTPIACIKSQGIDKSSKQEVIPSRQTPKKSQSTSKCSKQLEKKHKVHHNEKYSLLHSKVDEDDDTLNTSEEESP